MRLASLYSPVMSDYISPALLPITLQVDWCLVMMVVEWWWMKMVLVVAHLIFVTTITTVGCVKNSVVCKKIQSVREKLP